MKKIIMIDQDGVVCDNQYSTKYQTGSDVSNVISAIKESSDIIIVPNSDTPVERLALNFKEMVSYDPSVVIGELGAVVKIGADIFYAEGAEVLLGSYLKRIEECYSLSGIEVFTGDSATWVRRGRRFSPNSKIVLVDGMRRRSVAFYILRTDSSGTLFFDEDWFLSGYEMIKDIKLPLGLGLLVPDKGSGIVIGGINGVTKTSGFLVLKKKYPNATFYMIGNSDSDIINDPSVIHCSVGNGSESLKSVASFIAPSAITSGLTECLSWILQN